ncbi:MAG TPA: ABC transporter permease [Candidatus Acidoferrales bacterium]|nr:ABC transporter permease [Candidatus Acidoferrales bacterium]
MGNFWRDLEYGWRLLRKNPGFAAIAVLTLALGIGANAAIFSIVNAVVLRALPFPESQQLVDVWTTDFNRKLTRGSTPPADFLDWRAQCHVFQHLVAYQTWFFNLTGAGEPVQLWGVHVSWDFLDMLEVKLALGRTFRPDEEQPGHDQEVIISYGLWEQRFGGDPRIVGRNITIDYKPYTVVGVLPKGFDIFGTTGTARQLDLWMPLSFQPSEIRRDNPSLIVLGRLKPGVSVARANADLQPISSRLSMEYPATNQGTGVLVISMRQDLSQHGGNSMFILLATVGLVLLIACANVANLLLSRASARQREMSIRSALGARRSRVIRQLLTESVLLAFLGGAAGLLLAHFALEFLPALLSRIGAVNQVPRMGLIGINLPVLLFTLGATIATGIIFGLAPAFQVSKADLNESLKEGGRGSAGAVRSRFTRNILAISEVGLSLVLLIGAVMLIRSFHDMLSVDPGFNLKNVLSMQVWLPESHYPNESQIRTFFQQLTPRVRALPGVSSASAINFLPLTAWTDFANFDISDRPALAPRLEYVAQYRIIAPGYFRTMEIPLLRGRYFADTDDSQSAGAAIINEALARQYWPNEDPLQSRIRLHLQESTSSPWRPAVSDSWLNIVGIVNDVNDPALGRFGGDAKPGLLYLPYVQAPSRIMRIVLRTIGPPMALTSAAKSAVQSVDKDQPVTDVHSMEELLSESVSSQALNTTLVSFFAALALTLAAIGIYGVISYGVEQQMHEIGIRMALGAQPADVLRLVIRQGMKLALIGILFGLVGGYAMTRLLANLTFGIKSLDPIAALIAIAILLTVALLACYIPARRATRIDPMQALRYE